MNSTIYIYALCIAAAAIAGLVMASKDQIAKNMAILTLLIACIVALFAADSNYQASKYCELKLEPKGLQSKADCEPKITILSGLSSTEKSTDCEVPLEAFNAK